MRMVVRFQNGLKVEALILAAHRDQIRVVVAGRRETEEWLMVDGGWYDDSGRRVDIQAVVALDGIDCADFCGNVYPRTAAAGPLTN